ncbi:hypothetical protein EOS93_16790 [Rhizobium sp. RMa-01]|nr:hypothetical protein EOS93_16790 [Rhizobium sp. RMa-01]
MPSPAICRVSSPNSSSSAKTAKSKNSTCSSRAVQVFAKAKNRSKFLFTQFRTENRFALFLELL